MDATVGELEIASQKNNGIVPIIEGHDFFGYFTPDQITSLKAQNTDEEIIKDKIPLLNPVFVSASRSLQEVLDYLDENHLEEIVVIDKIQDKIEFRGIIGWKEIFSEESKIVQYRS
jgi:predicted transcriptional regulator